MGKYNSEAKQLLNFIGDKENIVSVTHCVTRMRFVLNDMDKLDTKSIENIPSVKGTFVQDGKFQVIIGDQVEDFYDELTELAELQ